ncbi:TetR family transcriptional regulator [Brachybacterium sp. GCM10030267]|uniref:TetR/AcrR family transcriptional regulator n=1 Tax=unclassified Brachybacterium TaxID=2623841 RepID=UPI00361E0842
MRRSAAETKQLIRAAARERFARDGYEGTTIRALAQDVGIDPALVMRHVGSKEALFADAVDLDLRLPDLSQIPADEIGAVLTAHFLDRWEGEDELLMILLRSAATTPAAADRLRAIFAEQVVRAVQQLGIEPADARHRAGLVATQMLGLGMCRYILQLPPVVEMDRGQVVDALGSTLQRYLVP